MAEDIFVKQDGTLTVSPKGRLDTATSPVLEKEMRERLDGVRNIVMDLKDVEYLSSGGIRLMLAMEQELEDRGGKMTVIRANQYILEVFDMVGFMDVVEVVRG